MEIVHFNRNFVEFLFPLKKNIKNIHAQLNLYGFRQDKTQANLFSRQDETSIFLLEEDSVLFVKTKYQNNIGGLIVNLSQSEAE